ncbi:HD domain-containing protein [Glutamicibacter sp. NPDC087344]|uniref:HD domain-containing protein n=1 Tax=Glutamicibacter sp. NPDC087344 TaxID=3363994 RepID=UPI003805F0AE
MEENMNPHQESELEALARRIATEAHRGQVDKLGEAYIGHPARVAGHARRFGGDENAAAAAWLHDVIEDCDITGDELAARGIPHQVLSAVQLLSKRPGQSLEEYCLAVKENPLALLVKRADLADNTDPARTSKLSRQTRERLAAKYARTRKLLGLDS